MVVDGDGQNAFRPHLPDDIIIQHLENFLFESLSVNLDTTTLDGKARLSKLAAPLLNRLPQGVYRELMYKELARRTDMEVAALSALVIPEQAAEPPPDQPAETTTPRPRQRQPLA